MSKEEETKPTAEQVLNKTNKDSPRATKPVAGN
jgi:hypothetical protein